MRQANPHTQLFLTPSEPVSYCPFIYAHVHTVGMEKLQEPTLSIAETSTRVRETYILYAY